MDLKSGQLIALDGRATLAAASTPDRPRFTLTAYTGGSFRPSYPPLPPDMSMVLDLAGIKAGRERIPLLLDHNDERIVGQTSFINISSRDITGEGIVTGDITNPDDPACKVTTHARAGFVWSLSVGVAMQRVEKIEAGISVTVNGQSFIGPLFVVRAGSLDEISFLSIGADRTASATIAAGAGGSVDWVAIELDRVRRIHEVCAGSHDATRQYAIAAGWGEGKTAREVLATEMLRDELSIN